MHLLEIEAEDEAGLRSERVVRFEIDTEAPNVKITYPPPGTHVSAPTIDVLGISEPDAQIELQNRTTVRHSLADSDGAFVIAAVPLWSGDNTIRVRATDALGNVGTWVSTTVLNACGTANQVCSIFHDGFETLPDPASILRDGMETQDERLHPVPPPAPEQPPKKRRDAATDRVPVETRRSLVSLLSYSARTQ
jgi:hypothetical protein